jgi:benzoyl-CoA reductase subunit C
MKTALSQNSMSWILHNRLLTVGIGCDIMNMGRARSRASKMMVDAAGSLRTFHEVVNNRHQYAQRWKGKTGRKVMGYLCTYVPEELIYAAGILPVRILGSHESQDITQSHISEMYCPFCRDCLAQGLKGRYSYLDGLTHANSCIHIRQTFDSWRRHVPISYSYYLVMPAHVESHRAQGCLVGELTEFKHSLEQWIGQPISEIALDKAIEVYNTNRRLMREVYELRKNESPPISGAESMEIVLSSMFMDKEEHNQLLQQALGELQKRQDGAEPRVRLMTLGSENDNVDFVRLTESLGAHIVIDDLCTGSRYFWNEIILEGDRLSAIATRYINRPPCPHKDLQERRRFPHILNLAKDWNAQGVIVAQQKFCDIHGYDIPSIQSLLWENGIPTLFLELDVTIPAGQFRTRIEAFLEILQLENYL